MKHLATASLVLAALLHATVGACKAGNWPGWRGPTGMGHTDEKDLPLHWDGKTKTNLLWKMPLGGNGNSSPIVWGDRVFVTVARKQTDKEQKARQVPEHWVSCFQADDGKELWRTPIPPGHFPRGYNIYAVPTPVTDGKLVFCWFSSGVLAALDFDGKIVWRDEIKGDLPKHIDGLINSPLLFEDTVIRLVNVDQSSGSGVVQALNKNTGKVKWERKLPRMNSANATPLLLKIDGNQQLIVPSSHLLEGVNPVDGSTLWTFKRPMGDLSPIYANGLLVTDRPGGPALGIDVNGTGDLTKAHVKWKIDKTPSSYTYASPVLSGDTFYRTQGPGILYCWKLSSGEQVYAERLTKITSLASPVSTADGRLYFLTSGISYVLEAGARLKVLAKNELGGFHGNNGPSPAIANGRIYLRDAELVGKQAYLYCIGKK